MTSKELLQLMGTRPLAEVVDTYVFSGEPYVFHRSPTDYRLLVEDLSSSLSMKPENITIVGSAKTGFSMSPDAFGAPFSEKSDVDVVVVDADRFDELWFTLLSWDTGSKPLKGFLKSWKLGRRSDVFKGRLFTGEPFPRQFGKELRFFRDFRDRWFSAFKSVGLRHPSLAAREFSGRLYRTWEHARTYHVSSLRKCLESNKPGAGAP